MHGEGMVRVFPHMFSSALYPQDLLPSGYIQAGVGEGDDAAEGHRWRTLGETLHAALACACMLSARHLWSHKTA